MRKTTTRFACSCVFSLLLCFCERAAATALSVGNGRASQRTGTRLVDVYYDVSGGVPPYTVTLQGSSDGGTTWTLPVTTVSGNVGVGVPAGTNLQVTWNAGADWAGQVSANVKFQVNVTDSTPDGFALIPAGSFQMGDQSSPLVGYSDELPVHTVQVSAFYMGKYLVTKADWDAVRTWGLTHGYTDLAAGAGKATNHPVQSMTWYDMVKWCDARSEKEGLTPCYTVSGAVYRTGSSDSAVCNWSANGYRLPSEAEWEKAARGGLVGMNFPWGNTISGTDANYSYTGNPYQTGDQPWTSPVGSYAPNGYGLYDMAGNVFEWCWDWHGNYTAGSQTDPCGPASGSGRVYRGGGWNGNANFCRVAARYFSDPGFNGYYFGFRVALSSVSSSTLTNTISLDTRETVSTLAALTLSSGTLSPAFAPPTTSYVAVMAGVLAQVTVTPTTASAYATVTVNGATVASGSASPAITLMNGTNTISVVVTAQDGTTTTAYTITMDNTPYGIWKGSVFTTPSDLANPNISGLTATPAHDGVTNLMKFALAIAPMTSGVSGLPNASTGGGYLTLIYRKNKQATDVTFTVQASSSLSANSWSPATTVLAQEDLGTYWLVIVRDNVPSAGNPHRFMRLQVRK